MNPTLQLIHLSSVGFMTGIIWFVQCVHYPMLHVTDGPDPASGHAEYTKRMSRVVIPAMLMEMALQGLWVIRAPGPYAYGAGVLLLLVWASTFGLQVPLHSRLMSAYDARVHQRLVRTNWIRTAGWSLRLVLVSLPFA
jgi:hypothetical protein